MANFIQTGQKVQNQINITSGKTLKDIAEELEVSESEIIFSDDRDLKVSIDNDIFIIDVNGNKIHLTNISNRNDNK